MLKERLDEVGFIGLVLPIIVVATNNNRLKGTESIEETLRQDLGTGSDF